MTARVGIVDYGVGNLHSLGNAVRKIGAEADDVSRPESLSSCERVILPGVGAFAGAIANLRSSGMAEALDTYVSSGRPLMGVCLGMQLMCRVSLEDGEHEGMGWIDARVVPFPANTGLKVPHMGWNEIRRAAETPLLAGIEDGSDVYFVHSYHVVCDSPEDVALVSEYGETFVSGFARDNLYGLQFHPEKSQDTGLRLLANFLAA